MPPEDEHLERLLRGYRLPEPSPELDPRVLAEAAAILARPPGRALWEDVAHELLHRLGFGHVAWAVDLVTTTDAEYRVVFI